MSADLALLVLRLVIGGVVTPHGLLKLGLVGQGGSPAGVAKWFDSLGLRPGVLWAWVAIFAEAVGGLLTILGLGGPIGPAVVAGDLVVVTIVAHAPQGFWASGGRVGWEFPLPIAAGAFAIALLGSGGWSLDGVLGFSYAEQVRWIAVAVAAVGAAAALAARTTAAPKKA